MTACTTCTTPSKCGTTELGRKGPRCAGKANGPDNCDCLNTCGDDPWLRDGRSEPCAHYLERERKAGADALWVGLTSFRREWT
jgi:hypothetical protein